MADFKIEILEKMRKMAERANIQKEVFCYYLKGSQNYGLDDKNSDIDMVCVTVPSMRNLLFSNSYSPNFTIRTVEGSNENLITGMDLGDYIRKLFVGNYSIIESLFTPYVIVNEKYEDIWETLQKERFSFLKINPKKTYHSIVGQMKSYHNNALNKYRRNEPNGKDVANCFRMIPAARKYCTPMLWNSRFYELGEELSALKLLKESSDSFALADFEWNDENFKLPQAMNEKEIDLFKNELTHIFSLAVARGEE